MNSSDQRHDILFFAEERDLEAFYVAEDPVSKKVFELAATVARTPSTVLLTGESGVGKEVVARFIHENSPRAEDGFLAVNCAAMAPTLLESELFGHERGAFSGAIRTHRGLFERARGGTLLLDEVSEMGTDLQAKLLRVLQERVTFRVGGCEEIELDVRVIATSNRDLARCVEEGTFRADLYYRLNVFPLHIPSLRERPGDIEAIVRFYVPRLAEAFGVTIKGITRRALRRLEGYAFPGNIRELSNILERAVILAQAEDVLDVGHLVLDETIEAHPGLGTREASGVRFVPGTERLTDVRMRVILKTLEKYDGNRTRTAEALGVSLRTIRNKIRQYRELGIEVLGPGQDE